MRQLKLILVVAALLDLLAGYGGFLPGQEMSAAAQATPANPISTQQITMPVFTLNPAPAVGASVQLSGNPGPQTIFYWVVANYPIGNATLAGPFAITSAPNTLSASNFVKIAPLLPTGASTYDLLKTLTTIPPGGACACAVATAVAVGTVTNDQSNSTSAYTVSTVNMNAFNITLQNEVQGPNISHLILRQNNVAVSDLSALSAPTAGIPTQVVQSGLLAEYRMLPADSVAALPDYSGNGNNGIGTVGTAPTIIGATGGLNFTGNGAVSLPASLNSGLTFQFVLGFQFAGAGGYNAPIGGSAGASAANCTNLLLDNQHNTGLNLNNYHFESWGGAGSFKANWRYTVQGSALVTWEVGTGSGDQLAINNNPLTNAGNDAGVLGAGNYQLGGANTIGGTCLAPVTYLTGQIYYAVVYNRRLTQAEVGLNNQFLQQVMLARGIPLTLLSTSTVDQFLLDGDSEIGTVSNAMLAIPTPVNIYNLSAPGYTIEQLVADAPIAVDPYYQTAANRQTDLIWAGTNDSGGSAQTTINYFNGYCRARHLRGFSCGVMSMMDRSGVATFKNAYNALIRQYWTTFADYFVDIAADPIMGCDGCNANTTYFNTGLHPTVPAATNIVAQLLQRGLNRFYGNRDWSTATTYASAAPAATAITATAEVGSTVTVTTALNPPVGSCAVISGVTPVAYNNVSGECWNVLTTSAGSFTFTHFQTGLGPGTVFGTVSVPLQKDADVYTILNFGAGSFTLEPCGGFTGQKIYIKNVNAVSSTVTAFGNDLIDGAATATVAQNAVLVLQDKLTTPSTPVCSWVKVQNN